MSSDTHRPVQKVKQPPDTPFYIGQKRVSKPTVHIIIYNSQGFLEKSTDDLAKVLPSTLDTNKKLWIHVEGLQNVPLIEQIAQRFGLHPLTVEDILNVDQRSKVEEFTDYLFVTLKSLNWDKEKGRFSIEQFSVVIGERLVISFQDYSADLFGPVRTRLTHPEDSWLRKQRADFLAYRLMDLVVDNYFLVLERVTGEVEKLEDRIVQKPNKSTARLIYQLKRQILILRKVFWPTREVISRLIALKSSFISSFTHTYLRDIYDHAIQVMETVEIFRDMLANMLDVYLTSLSTRLNETMKTLTVIATVFIPLTFLTSLYGMNFQFLPGIHYKHAFLILMLAMGGIVVGMLTHFYRKGWWSFK